MLEQICLEIFSFSSLDETECTCSFSPRLEILFQKSPLVALVR